MNGIGGIIGNALQNDPTSSRFNVSRNVTITPVVSGKEMKSLTVLLGSSPPVVTGDGGWLIVNRPKRVGFTAWEGYSPQTMSLKVMFDGFSEGVPQEEKYQELRRMMRNTVGPAKQPAPVKVEGAALPANSTTWVIQSVDADSTSIIRGDRGELLRVEVTLSLLEYVEADVLVNKAAVSPATRVAEKVEVTNKSLSGYTVKVGDTLWSIAQQQLGAGKRYTEIATLNGIGDPNRVPVGTVLKMP